MVKMQTPVCNFGWKAVDFSLVGIDGQIYTLDNVKGLNGTLIMFICNHCPYVQAVIDRIVQNTRILQDEGIGIVAIMPNDTENYPDDSFDNMKIFAKQNNFSFPYVIDETQETARIYDAVCTPDFFGFNANLELQYRGRLDSSGKKEATSDTCLELLNAMRQIAWTGKGPKKQIPSMGCSIKWRMND